jgi:hypothetical protein
MSKPILLCVKKDQFKDYVTDNGKPKLRYFDADNLTVADYQTTSGTQIFIENPNTATSREVFVAEKIRQISTQVDPSSTTNKTGADFSASLTAYATGGQANAVSLTNYLNYVTTCATADDSVKLPAAAVDQVRVVYNTGAAACSVYPQSGAKLNGTTNGSSSVAAASGLGVFWCDGTNWFALAQS